MSLRTNNKTNSNSFKHNKSKDKSAEHLAAALKPVLEGLESRQMLSAGAPDASFNASGKRTDDSGYQDLGRTTLVEPSGKILVAGESQSRFALTQYNSNGSLNWQSLNVNTGVPFSSFSAIALQSDNKILVAGTQIDPVNGDSEFALARYTDAGALDSGFGDQGVATTDLGSNTRDIAYGVAIQSDGKIVVVGSTGAQGQENVALVRYTSEGVLDNTAGTGFGQTQSGIVTDGAGSANAVAIGSGDQVIVAGQNGQHTLIQQYDANGVLETSHTEPIGGSDVANAIVVQGSNYVVAGTVSGDFYAARFTNGLVLDPTFGSSGIQNIDFEGSDTASSLAVAPDGKLVLGGTTSNGASGTQDFAVARLNADGTLDNSFGTNGQTTVDFDGQNDVGTAAAVGADRKIVLAGYTSGATDNDFAVTQLEGNSPPAIGTTPASLDAIDEDNTSNLGNSVAELASRLGLSDPDGDVAGLAITAGDNSNGTWEYSTDGGTDWNAIGAVSPGSALLLSADSLNRLRFVPSADFNTTVAAAPTLSVVAWDGTQGANGGTADITDNSNHLNSFGTETGTLDQVVNAVNDAPSFTVGADQNALVGTGAQTISGWAKNIIAGPADENGQTLSFIVTEVSDPNGAVSNVSVDPNTGDLTFTPSTSAGVATFSIALKDNGGGTDTSATQTFNINVETARTKTWVNDNWVITNNVGAADLSLGDTVANYNDDGTVTGKTYGIDAFSTIQDGVDFTGAGGIEHVISGSYAENVIIDKALTLSGDAQSNTILVPEISAPLPLAGSASLVDGASNLILVRSSDVHILNLTVDGDNPALTSGVVVNGADIDARNGILTDYLTSENYDNLTIDNVTVKNVFLRGIQARMTGTMNIHDNTVDNVAGSVDLSIGIFNRNGKGVISNNTVSRTPDAISANHSQGTQFLNNTITLSQSGIHTDNQGDSGGVADLIQGNTISLGDAMGGRSLGIWTLAPTLNVQVSNNVISGVDVGLADFGGAGGETQFTGNSVHVNAAGTGALVTTDELGFGAANVNASFNGNTIAGGATGIVVNETGGAAAVVNVTGGSIIGATTGIDATTGSTVNVNGVSITGNSIGISYSGGAGGAVVNNNFADAGGNNNGTDLQLAADAGTITGGALTGNTFSGSNFYIVNQSPQDLTALSSSNNYQTAGATETDNFAIEKKIYHKIDNAASGLVTWVDGSIFVTPTTNPTATDNDYTRLANAVAAATSGDTIRLKGTFDWSESNAEASWALGNDGLANTADDYSLYIPAGLNGLTFTADSLGSATIKGPGDLANVNLEGVFVFDGGENKNTTISNLEIDNFDLSIAFFNGAGGVNAFDGTRIVNNHIVVAKDLNATDAPIDVNQNIGIHYSFGLNQIIQGNIIDLAGDAVSDSANGNFASEVGIQSNTSGGGVYDGLLIDNNTINVIGAQSSDPVSILGIWENGHAHSSNITVSNNRFVNQDAGNDPLLNLQRAFRITSHSSASSSVVYSGNSVSGANIGFQWIAGSDFSGELPVELIGNTLTNVGTGVLLQSNGSAHLSGNTFANSGGQGIGVDVAAGSSVTIDSTTAQNEITGFGTGVKVAGSADISDAKIRSGNVGVELASGGDATLNNVNFDGASANNNQTDLQIDDGAGNLTIGNGNNFAGDTFFINNQSAQDIDLSGKGTTFDETSNFRIEDKMFHKVDDTTLGLITWVAGNIYVTTPETGSTDSSIQRGVDAASAGDTVNVENGTYVEQVDIGKDLTLTGESQNGTIIKSPQTLANSFVWSGITYKPVVLAHGATVTVEQLTVDGAGQGNANNRFTGIGYYNADGTIDHTNVVGVRDSTLSGAQHGYGIIARDDDNIARILTISNNSVSDYQKNGIDVRGTGLTANIADNTVTGAGDTAVNAQNGIVVIDALAHISGNIVSGNEYSGPSAGADPLNDTQAIGILLTPAADGSTVDGNFVNGNDIGIYSLGNNITISNNQLGNSNANRYEGILIDQGSTTLDGNTIRGGNIGVAVIDFDGNTGPSAATLTNNTISDVETGIDDIGGTLTVGTGNLISGGTTGLAISGASAAITGNTLSNLAFDEQGGQYIALSDGALNDQEIDATGVSFDGVTGATATDAQNFAIEDKITHAVDDVSLGFVRVKTGNVFVTTNSGSIQRGVDVASTGDIVNVGDGTYVEQVNIGKDLTLRGQSQAGAIIQSPATLANSFVWSGITYKPVVFAHDANINVESLTVDGNGQGNTNNRFTGIGYYNAGGTVDHTTVVGVRDSVLSGVQHGYGIIARDDDSADRTLDITNNTVSDYQKNGVDVRGAGLTANITSNTITGAGDTAVNAQNGIVVVDSLAHISGNTVSGNEYSGNGGGADPLNDTQAIGILLTPAADGSTVDGNFVNGNDIGIYSLGNNISISNNQLGNTTANRYEGILVDQGSTTLNGNTISRGNIGIAVIGFDGNTAPSAAILNNNTITDAQTGVDVIGGTLTVGSGNTISGGTTGLAISGASSVLTGNSLNNLAFDEQSGQYISLSDGALDNQEIDATNVSFDGVTGATATNAQNFAIEDKITHAVDDVSLGFVRVKAGNVFVTTSSGSIQRAVDVASTGDTVNVGDGTYTEQVDIGKDLTLRGQSQGGTIIKSPATLANSFVWSGITYKPVVLAHDANVNVERMTVDGNGEGNTNNRFTGIGYYNAGGTVDHTTVVHVRDSVLSGVQHGYGIIARDDDSVSRTLVLTSNTVSDYQKNGIDVRGAGLTANIFGNTITGAGETSVNAQNGIVVVDSLAHISGNTVSGNEYSGNGGGADPLNDTQSIGILLTPAGDGSTVDGNFVDGNDIGIYSLGNDITISNNQLGNTTANRYEGILVDQGSTTLDGNTIRGGNTGIAVIAFDENTGPSAATLSNNTITDAETGIDDIGGTLTVASGNLISGGTTALAISGASSAITGNTLSNLAFDEQSGQYIALSDNALDNLDIDATAVTFDGVTGATATNSQRHAIENKIFHEVDDASLGFIRTAVIDTVNPTVISSVFHFEDAPQRITIQFSEDVKDSLSLDDFTLVNLLTNQTIDSSNMTLTYDEVTNTATLTFHDLPTGNYLGTGRYELTVSSAGVTDPSGNTLNGDGSGGDHVLDFFQMAGDANRDQTVDFADLVAVAQHYGINDGNQTWATGDFNYDGKVDFEDLVVVAQNYGKTLPPAPTTAPSPAPMPASLPEAAVSSAPETAPVVAAAPTPVVPVVVPAPLPTPVSTKPVSTTTQVLPAKVTAAPAPVVSVAVLAPLPSPVTTTPASTTTKASPAIVAKSKAATLVSMAVATTVPVKSTVKPVQKPKVQSTLVPVQASANAPFAARTQLRVQNRPISLIGGVVEKQKRDRGQLFGSDSSAFKL